MCVSAGSGEKSAFAQVDALEIADHDQLPPAMVVLGSRRQHAGGQVQRPIHVEPLRQRAAAGQLVAQGVEIGRRAVEHALRPRAGQNQVGRQPRPVAEIIGGHGPRPLDLLDGARRGRPCSG